MPMCAVPAMTGDSSSGSSLATSCLSSSSMMSLAGFHDQSRYHIDVHPPSMSSSTTSSSGSASPHTIDSDRPVICSEVFEYVLMLTYLGALF